MSYTRNYADAVIPNLSPHGVNAGLGWSRGRLSLNASAAWRDYVPLNAAFTSFNRHRLPIDVGGSLQLSRRVTVFVTGRNVRSEQIGRAHV